ncbi:hypothetical protein GCM10017687_79790 [Streptomyces echinatus]
MRARAGGGGGRPGVGKERPPGVTPEGRYGREPGERGTRGGGWKGKGERERGGGGRRESGAVWGGGWGEAGATPERAGGRGGGVGGAMKKLQGRGGPGGLVWAGWEGVGKGSGRGLARGMGREGGAWGGRHSRRTVLKAWRASQAKRAMAICKSRWLAKNVSGSNGACL